MFARAAVNSLKATGWEIFLARLFGKKTVVTEIGMRVTTHWYRGKHYLTGCKRV